MRVDDPFDPERKVMGGVRYLRQLLDRSDGHLDAALAAYNRGPRNFERNPDRLPKETRQDIARIKTRREAPSKT